MDENKKEKIDILFVSSECDPFCSRGGLSDFSHSIPKYLNRKENVDIRVVLPNYGCIPKEFSENFELVGERTVELTWRKEYCGILEYEYDGITYYFIDNKQYFDREKIYGYGDDVERFSFFSKAVLDMLPIINFFPDIIHTNDWQTGIVCAFLKMLAWQNPKYEHIKTVLTVHNFTFQGKANLNVVRDLLGIEEKFTYLFDAYGSANILKASLLCADQIVTVSETYKQEVKNNQHGCGISFVLDEIEHKFTAVTNGVDYEIYDPEKDKNLYLNYNKDNAIEVRKQIKAKLQEEMGLDVDENSPLYLFVSILEQGKGIELMSATIRKYLSNGAQLIAMGYGNPEYVNFFVNLQSEFPTKVHYYSGYNHTSLRNMFAGCDFFLSLKTMEPCGLFPLVASKYGCQPIVYLTGGITDNFTDFKYNGGNGYVLKEYSAEALDELAARTIRHFENKEKSDAHVITVMEQDFDIASCVNGYLELYEKM